MRGELRTRVDSNELEALKQSYQLESRKNRQFMLSIGLAVVATLLVALEAGPWRVLGLSSLGIGVAGLALISFLRRPS